MGDGLTVMVTSGEITDAEGGTKVGTDVPAGREVVLGRGTKLVEFESSASPKEYSVKVCTYLMDSIPLYLGPQ